MNDDLISRTDSVAWSSITKTIVFHPNLFLFSLLIATLEQIIYHLIGFMLFGLFAWSVKIKNTLPTLIQLIAQLPFGLNDHWIFAEASKFNCTDVYCMFCWRFYNFGWCLFRLLNCCYDNRNQIVLLLSVIRHYARFWLDYLAELLPWL